MLPREEGQAGAHPTRHTPKVPCEGLRQPAGLGRFVRHRDIAEAIARRANARGSRATKGTTSGRTVTRSLSAFDFTWPKPVDYAAELPLKRRGEPKAWPGSARLSSEVAAENQPQGSAQSREEAKLGGNQDESARARRLAHLAQLHDGVAVRDECAIASRRFGIDRSQDFPRARHHPRDPGAYLRDRAGRSGVTGDGSFRRGRIRPRNTPLAA